MSATESIQLGSLITSSEEPHGEVTVGAVNTDQVALGQTHSLDLPRFD